jgi:hypothetical protein
MKAFPGMNRAIEGCYTAADAIIDGAQHLLERTKEIIGIYQRANAAAQEYEQLKPQSDEELAARGLSRTDLPRKAFDELTKP